MTEQEAAYRIQRDWHIGVRGCDFLLPQRAVLREGHVTVAREILGYSPALDPFIELMRATAAGLEDARVVLVSDEDGDGGLLFIQGDRPVTEHDEERFRDRARRADARDRAEFERLKAKFHEENSDGC